MPMDIGGKNASVDNLWSCKAKRSIGRADRESAVETDDMQIRRRTE